MAGLGRDRGPTRRAALGVVTLALAALAVAWLWRDGGGSRQSVDASAKPQATASGGLRPSELGAVDVPDTGAGLAGRVTDDADVPLRGAEVCAHAKQLDMLAAPRHCARTDKAGRYRLEGLPGGPYSVVASAPEHESQRAKDEPLVLGRDEQRTELDFALRAAPSNVQGVVRDALGGVVADAHVRIVTAVPPHQAAAAQTDDEGRFALHFPEGPVVATANAEGYAPDERTAVVPAAGLELTLAPGGRIAGVVQQADGTPVADVTVRPEHGGVLGASSRLFSHSDASGRFEVLGLPPGAYRLVAQGAHVQGAAEQAVPLGLGESVDDVVITVEPASRVVGRVLRQGSGEPCAQGTVMLSGMPDPMQEFPSEFVESGARPLPVPTQVASIGAEGAVELPGVPAGTYYAVVRCDGHRFVEGPARVTLQAESGDVGPLDWFVVPAATLTVRTVDGRGEPVGRQSLRLRMPPPGPGLGHAVLQMITDAAGVVRVPDLREGTYAIGPMDAQLGDAVEVQVREGDRDLEVTLPLRGSASLTVTVVDEHERPVEGLQVMATPVSDGDDDAPARPHGGAALGAGRYALEPLPPGTYRVEASDGINPAFHDGSGRGLRMLAGEHAELTLRVDRGAQIRGRVTDADGMPAVDVWVSARAQTDGGGGSHRSSASGGRVMTDERGEFTLGGLSTAGVYRVTASEPYGAEASVDDVAAGASIEVQLPATGRLEGQLRAADGSTAPVHLARATSVDGRIERLGRVSSDHMRFAIDSLPVGEVRLIAASADGRVVSAQVHVTAGDEPTHVELALAELGAEPGAQPGPHPGVENDTQARTD